MLARVDDEIRLRRVPPVVIKDAASVQVGNHNTTTMTGGGTGRERAVAHAEVVLDYEVKSGDAAHHQYLARATIKNVGKTRFDDWEIQLELPTPFITPEVLRSGFVGSRVLSMSNETVTVFRTGHQREKRALRPGEHHTLSVATHMTNEMYWRGNGLLDRILKASGSVSGEVVGEVEKTVRAMQRF